jgi:hypothetical protein
MHFAYVDHLLVNSSVLAAMEIKRVTALVALFCIYPAVCEYWRQSVNLS